MSSVCALPSAGEIAPRILVLRAQRAFVRLREMVTAHDAAQHLMHGAQRLLRDGREYIFDQWCPADVDLVLMLNHLLANGDCIPDWAGHLYRTPLGPTQRARPGRSCPT